MVPPFRLFRQHPWHWMFLLLLARSVSRRLEGEPLRVFSGRQWILIGGNVRQREFVLRTRLRRRHLFLLLFLGDALPQPGECGLHVLWRRSLPAQPQLEAAHRGRRVVGDIAVLGRQHLLRPLNGGPSAASAAAAGEPFPFFDSCRGRYRRERRGCLARGVIFGLGRFSCGAENCAVVIVTSLRRESRRRSGILVHF